MKHRHFVLHKPPSYLSQFVYYGTRVKNKGLLGQLFDFPEGTMAIGRLDLHSEGLIFLTTDGKVSEEIRSAKYEKEYYVQVQGIITDEAIQKMRDGVNISHRSEVYLTKPAIVERITELDSIPFEVRQIRSINHGPTSWISVIIREGRYRQVRKMTSVVGFPTQQLGRVRIGNIKLDLAQGDVREVDGFG